MIKLPDEVKLKISLQFGKNIWEITQILKLFWNKLEAREKKKIKNNLSKNKPFSDSAINTFTDNKKNSRESNLRQDNNQKYCENPKKPFEKHA